MQCEDGPQRPPAISLSSYFPQQTQSSPHARPQPQQPTGKHVSSRVRWLPASLRHAHLPAQEAGTERRPEDPYPRREGKRLALCMVPASSSGKHASRQHLSQTRGCGRLQCPLPPGFAQQHARQGGHQLLSLSAAKRTGPREDVLPNSQSICPLVVLGVQTVGLSLGRVEFGLRKDAVPMSRCCGSRSMCSGKQWGGGARAGWAPGLWNKKSSFLKQERWTSGPGSPNCPSGFYRPIGW